jgi:NAD(P)H-hydrate epimerase
VVALGPGLGRSQELTTLVTTVLAQARVPLVLDADGLNALEHHSAELRRHAGPVVITPHPGEFARLAGCQVADVQARRQERAARFAAEHGVIVILKGYGTVVTDGRRVYVNTTGNPGMATGGTGDVLTGLIAALLGQGLEPFAAAQLGVHVHGLAGDLARDELGEVSLIASDLVEFLPHAFRNL